MRQRALLTVASVLALSFSVLSQNAVFPWPDTPAGRIAARYFKAFKSGSDAEMTAFIKESVSPASLAQRPLEARLAITRNMRAEMGDIEPQRVIASENERLVILVRTGKGALVEFSFLLDPSAPGKLSGILVREGEAPGPESAVPVPPSVKDLPRALDDYLRKETAAGAFSGVVLVARGETTLFHEAYGLAERSFSMPVRKDTKFNLGSINKFFTKIAVAKLVEQGELSLDDKLARFLPDYPNAEAAAKVTVRMLVDHTSGIGDIFGDAFEATAKDRLRTNQDYLRLFAANPLLFEPGTSQRYSNGGYVVLGAIIEKVTGKSYYDFVREMIYAPAGMIDTGSYEADASTPNLAEGYTAGGEDRLPPGQVLRNNIYSRPARGSAAGGGYSTAEDLLRFVRALRAGRLLGPAGTAWVFGGPEPGTDKTGTSKGASLSPLGIAGGAPGINADLELSGDDVIIVLSNLDPPAARRVGSLIAHWLEALGPGAR